MENRSRFNYESPQTVSQAFEYLQTHQDADPLAGGTDYIPLLKKGLKKPNWLIGLSQIEYLSMIEKREQGLFVGAMSRLSTLAENDLIRKQCLALSEAAGLIASSQIRNRGTIGGNICQDRRCIYFNQSQSWRQSMTPCYKTGGHICHQQPRSENCRAIYHSDLAPVLMAVGAHVECYDVQGFYELPIEELIHEHISRSGGIRSGARLISGFIIPHLPSDAWIRFVKQSIRSSIDFSIINAAVCYLPPDDEDLSPKVSVVVGAVAPAPLKLIETQKLVATYAPAGVEKKEHWFNSTVAEINQKSALITDTGISLSARRKAFGVVGLLMEQLHDYLSERSKKP